MLSMALMRQCRDFKDTEPPVSVVLWVMSRCFSARLVSFFFSDTSPVWLT